MPTDIEYAQLSNRVYNRTQRNRTPIPSGWTPLTEIADQADGFSAGVYRNGSGTEIVISYTGTNEARVVDFLTANIPAGAGLTSTQVVKAMALYIDTRRLYPNATISFTGHSLGGGLASLMAVFFDEAAVAFDSAPFQATALSPLFLPGVAVGLALTGRSDAAFSEYLSSFATLFFQREANVRGISLEGEALAILRAATPTIEATHEVVPIGPQTMLQGLAISPSVIGARVSLHSMSLLASMIASPAFAQAVRGSPQLLALVFDNGLYARDPQLSEDPNFMDRLYVANVGNPVVPLLDRFAADVARVSGSEGTSNANGMQRALLVAAMEYYYFNEPSGTTQLFDTAGGHIHFRWSDIAASVGTLNSPHMLADSVWSIDDALGNAAQTMARDAQAWHLQSGAAAMTWSDTAGLDDAAIGGAQGDSLDGGAGSDLLMGLDGTDALIGGAGADALFGGADADSLDGGADSDVLYGGAGTDEYRFSGTWGTDIIHDSGNDGVITLQGIGALTGADTQRTASGVWQSGDGRVHYTQVAADDGNKGYLLISVDDGATRGSIRIDDWSPGRLGITLSEQDAPVPAPDPVNDFDGDFVRTRYIDAQGQLRYETRGDTGGLYPHQRYVPDSAAGPQADAQDILNGTVGDNHLRGLGGNDGLSGSDGDDTLEGGAGDDLLLGGVGQDRLEGGQGDDILLGSALGGIAVPTRVDFEREAIPQGAVERTRGFSWTSFGGAGPRIGQNNTVTLRVSDVVGAWTGEAWRADDGLVYVESTGNVLDGGAGSDVIVAGTGADVAHGGSEDDDIFGGSDADLLFGDAGADIIVGDGLNGNGDPDRFGLWYDSGETHGNDVIDGGAGNDFLWGTGGADELFGGADNDKLWGDHELTELGLQFHGADYLDGGIGNDEVTGNGRNDILFGGTVFTNRLLAANEQTWRNAA